MSFESLEDKSSDKPSKSEEEFEYCRMEYDEQLAKYGIFVDSKIFNANTGEYEIRFGMKTGQVWGFKYQGVNWEACFLAMLEEAKSWREDFRDPIERYEDIKEQSKKNPKAVSAEDAKFFLDNVKEEDYELAATIKKAQA